MDLLDADGVHPTAIREVAILKGLQYHAHPNIVKVHDVQHSQSGESKLKLFIVFEYCDYDLRKYIKQVLSPTTFDPQLVKMFLHQILEGLVFCHNRAIVHRDLKPENVLIKVLSGLGGATPIAKLADFGLARGLHSMTKRQYTKEVVTIWYRCPEVLLGEASYGYGIDVWSVGCIFVELVNRKPLFPGNTEIDMLFKIFKVMGSPEAYTNNNDWSYFHSLPEYSSIFPKWSPLDLRAVVPNLCETGCHLLGQLLSMVPAKRISAAEALKHPYFADL